MKKVLVSAGVMVLLAAIILFVNVAFNGFSFAELNIQRFVYETLTAWVIYYLAVYFNKKNKEKNKDKDTDTEK